MANGGELVTDFSAQHKLLDRVVRGDERAPAVQWLRCYFRDSGAAGALFTGRWFDRLAGGGDAHAVRDVVTAADILALTCLGITNDLPELAVDLLEHGSTAITNLLREIPVVAMHDVPASEYDQCFGPQSASWRLWELLRRSGGTNRWVMANKLLARKRPHLLPVYDEVVRQQLDESNSVWRCLWEWFHNDRSCVDAVRELRTEAGGIEDISLLRCLDVVLWMRGRETNRSS